MLTASRKTLAIAAGSVALAAAGMVALYWREWGAQLAGAALVALLVTGLLLVIVATVQRWETHPACQPPPVSPGRAVQEEIPLDEQDMARRMSEEPARLAALHHAQQAARAAVRAGWAPWVVAQACHDAALNARREVTA